MGEVQNVLVQKRRNKHAALKLLRRLLRNQAIHPETITTDKLASYRAAALAGLSGGRLIPYQKPRFSQF